MLNDVTASVYSPRDTGWVSPVRFTHEDILGELERVSRSALGKKKALQKMLRFVVKATLDNQTAYLKEYTIATLVFGKGDNFDPRMTSLVRTQAHKLREVLLAYYSADPGHPGPWVWIPPGSYRAVFHRNPTHNPLGRIPEVNSGEADSTIRFFQVAEPTVLSRGSDLSSIASAVVRLQRDHPALGRGGASTTEASGSSCEYRSAGAGALAPSEFEVKHTIVELDDTLVLTAYLLAGKEKAVVFGRSFSVGWSGNAGAFMSQIAPELSAFICTAGMIVDSLERRDR